MVKQFIHWKDGTSGKTVSDVILHQLVQLGYDKAGNMSGKNKGVIKNIQDRCGKVLGCHCQAHLLNLCVVSACKINSVVVMMNKLRCVQEFPKRLSLLSGMIDECDLPQIKKKRLKDCCRPTRWVQRVESFTIFLDLFKVICDALSHISENVGDNWNSDSMTLASCHLLSICNFEFIINLVVLVN